MEFNTQNIPSLIAGAAIIGTVLTVIIKGWSTLRDFFVSSFRYIVNQITIEDEKTAQLVLAYLVKTYKIDGMAQKTYGGKQESFKDGKYGHIPYEFFGSNQILFWNGWFPIWYNVYPEKSDEKIISWGSKSKPATKVALSFIRGTVNVDDIIKKASEDRNKLFWANGKSTHSRFFIKKIPDASLPYDYRYSAGSNLEWFNEGVYRLLAHDPQELGKATSNIKKGKCVDNLYFPDHIKDLISEVELWHKLKDWYKERGIPWKRGWVLYGPPGTGKTAIVRAIAEDHNMPLFVFSLGQMLNSDLEKSWAEMQSHVPCIALFEDFDNVFHGRTNVYGKPSVSDIVQATSLPTQQGNVDPNSALNIGKLTFDCLLNCIDGVDKIDGIFTIITTNHIDKLDPALGIPTKSSDGTIELISTRPGRIDKAVELGYMKDEDKICLAKRIFFDSEEGFDIMCEKIQGEPDKQETPAQFQERCAQLALKMLWAEKKKKPKFHLNGRHIPVNV